MSKSIELKKIYSCEEKNKPTLVCYTLNEEDRIKWLYDYYKDICNLVILDGGSKDKTIEIAKLKNISIYERVKNNVGIDAFIYYSDKIAPKNNILIFLSADEYIEKNELKKSIEFFKGKKGYIFGKRIDWIYGKKINTKSTLMPRVFYSKTVKNSKNMHGGIIAKNKNNLSYRILNVHHLHVQSVGCYYGHFGSYAEKEIKDFIKSDKTNLKIFKRFILRELFILPFVFKREIKKGIPFLLAAFLTSVANSSIGLLCAIELKYLSSVDAQKRFYKTFYKKDK